ncbi:glycosyl hydrolase family 18 protein [Kitasatospora sp. NPDC094015]|uniref:glycosyl hydrolase family 18 protein n=1 Tax=Kitasatospora sp. NPDC094015 TaxID=3155205 RepID=UPI0033205B97
MRLYRSIQALLTTCATVAASAGLLALGGGTAHAATPLPQHVFAPYFEAWTGDNPATLAAQSGAKHLTMAFLQTASKGSCTPLWNGDTGMPVSSSVFGSEIATIRANGGDVIPSFGGYTADNTGTELADSCTDVNAIAAAFEKVVTTYDVSRIDLDIEDNSLTNTAGIDRRNKAIKLVQDWAAANGRSVQFSYTLPTTTSGLAASGLAVLKNAVQNNARIDVVNQMTFDYYDNASHTMGEDTKTATTGLYNQLAKLYPTKTPAQLWGSIGIIEMIGIDDFGPAETFTLADATNVYNWAVAKGVNTLSFWALQRDNGGCVGTAGSDSCSGISQGTWDFSHIFAPFTGGGQTANDFSVGLAPTSGAVNPGGSASATLSTAVTAGSAQTLNLAVTGAPAGVTASLSASTVTTGTGATLNITTTAAATPGSYPLTVTATAPSGTHTATYTLTVNGQVANDFSVSLAPTSGAVNPGGSASATLSTAVTAGSAQTLNLAVTGAPAGVTASLSASTVTTGTGATLNITTTAAATPGSYPLTVTATAPSGTHTATYTLTVNATGGTGLVNGGLESGSLSPWTCQSGGSVVSTPVHSGGKALQAAATASQTGECGQSVTLAPNTKYTLSAWVQGSYAFLGVSGGATASTWTSSTGWTKLSVPFTTGASGTVTVYLHGWFGQGSVYGDDFTVS